MPGVLPTPGERLKLVPNPRRRVEPPKSVGRENGTAEAGVGPTIWTPIETRSPGLVSNETGVFVRAA
jgi:hypothetical protein